LDIRDGWAAMAWGLGVREGVFIVWAWGAWSKKKQPLTSCRYRGCSASPVGR